MYNIKGVAHLITRGRLHWPKKSKKKGTILIIKVLGKEVCLWFLRCRVLFEYTCASWVHCRINYSQSSVLYQILRFIMLSEVVCQEMWILKSTSIKGELCKMAHYKIKVMKRYEQQKHLHDFLKKPSFPLICYIIM